LLNTAVQASVATWVIHHAIYITFSAVIMRS